VSLSRTPQDNRQVEVEKVKKYLNEMAISQWLKVHGELVITYVSCFALYARRSAFHLMPFTLHPNQNISEKYFD
jgi:hypothetical protein